MRNPNGYNVRKLSGKRRRPYQARKLVGYRTDDENRKASPVYQTIGYYATRREAIEAIAGYYKDPYDLDSTDLTLEEVYAMWKEQHFPDISKRTSSLYENVWEHLAPLHKRTMKELKAFDFERVIMDDSVPRTMKQHSRTVLSQLYRYAIKHEIVTKDISKMLTLSLDTRTQIHRAVFTREDLDALLEQKTDIADAIIVGIYTGFRPDEILTLRGDHVNLEEGYIQHGMKTEAGRDRIVPIHPDILPIIKKRASRKKGKLFNMSYTTYRARMKKLEPIFQESHTPHDTRHTFATYAKKCRMDPFIVKKIMGHAVTDITEKVYTHYDLDDLKNEMLKYRL